MKKKILLLTMCLLTAMSAQAANWLHLENQNPDLKLFIDTESIDYVSPDICNYAIIFHKAGEVPQVAYVKANKTTNEIGVYQAGDYSDKEYNPEYVFNHTKVFMKPLKSNSFLAVTQKYASSMSSQYVVVNQKTKKQTKADKKSEKNIVQINDFKTYVKLMKEDILANWHPPKVGQNTQAEVLFVVGSDGSLFGYKILKSSGHETVDRSIISAAQLAAPYRYLPQISDSFTDNVNIKLVFDYKKIKKEIR